MEKRRRMQCVDDEFDLPQPIIQHIQSFLDDKQAAQTAAISKSWNNAWSTRPNLQFYDRHFIYSRSARSETPGQVLFLDFVKKTLQRYEKLHLKIDSIKLQMFGSYLDSSSSVNEMILKIFRMGVSDIDLYGIILPPCLEMSHSRVKSLCLRGVIVSDDSLLCRAFPCLENLTLHHCVLFKTSSLPTVKSLFLTMIDLGDDFVSCAFPCVENLYLEHCSFRRCNSEELLSRSFPCLEDLTMKGCHDTQALQISSSSLKFISLTKLNNSRINFNVPNICKFKYSGFFSPSRFQVLSFQTVSREWESDITLHMEYGGRDDSWVHQLRRFIKKLSMSRIALNIEFRHSFGSYKYAGCLKGTRGPSIDNLKLLNLSQYSMTVDFLDGLLWSCRPKLINQHWFPASCVEKNEDARASNEFIKLLSTRLTEVHKNLSADYQMPFGNQVLDGVNVECFDSTHLEWQLMPWKMLLNDAESPKRKEQIRFKLEWHGKRLHSES